MLRSLSPTSEDLFFIQLETYTQRYEAALSSLIDMHAAFSEPESILEATSRLSQILNEINQVEGPPLAELLRNCRESGLDQHEPFRAILDRAKHAMNDLLARIDQLSRDAQSSRDRLTPVVDDTVQEHRAAAAYGRVSSSRFGRVD